MSTDHKKQTTLSEDDQQVTASASANAWQMLSSKQKHLDRKGRKPRRRLFPIWLRLLVIPVLAAVALGAGLMIGYGVVGDGNPLNALKWETWQHIIDLVTKGT